MTSGVLSGVRVIDFTKGLSGPFATQILGDLGADVVKVESPTGDEQRIDRGSSRPGETPAGFVAYNRNKRSVMLDLKSSEGLEAARRLVSAADVVVQNFRTGVMARFQLDYESVRKVNPSVVYCSISGFGSEGPLATKAANDIVIQALSGLMSITGMPGMEPVRAHGYPADLTTGVWSAMSMLAAVHHRSNTGEGQHVQVSMIETVLASLGRVYGNYFDTGSVPQPLGSGTDMGTPNGAFPASDGWVTLAALSDARFAKACQALGLDQLVDDPKFGSRELRREHADSIIEAFGEVTSSMTRAEAIAALEAEGVSCAEVRTVPEVAADPVFSRAFVDLEVDGGREARTVGSPMRFSATPVTVRHGIPALGEHTGEVLAEFGATDAGLHPAEAVGR